jgi:hypothetical protein
MAEYTKETEFTDDDWAAAIDIYTDPFRLQSPPDRKNSYLARGTDGSAYAALAYTNHPVHGPGFGVSVVGLGDDKYNTQAAQERVDAWLHDFVEGKTGIGTMVDDLNSSTK